jgi:hypothetical protein
MAARLTETIWKNGDSVKLIERGEAINIQGCSEWDKHSAFQLRFR